MGQEPQQGSSGSPGTLDWAEVHRRLDALRQTIDHGWRLSGEDKREILRARAEALARAASRPANSEETLEVVEFQLAHEHYGIQLSCVREVYPLKDLIPLPGTPAFILGITNVRGQVLSIIDIKRLFGLPEKELTDFNKIIILHESGMEIGVLADAVVGVKSVRIAEIQPSLPALTGIREDFLRGVTRESTVLLDAHKLLAVRSGDWRGAA